MNKLLIVGAGGHGRVVADIAKLSGKYDQIAFMDDADIRPSADLPVLAQLGEIDLWLREREVLVAIGDNQTRRRIMNGLQDKGAQFATLIHPSAVIADNVQIGHGSVIMANAVVNCGSRIGSGVIINTAATVDHDNDLRDYVHISPGVHLAGTVQVGEMTWIGIGAIVSNNVEICGGCTVGAGAVVIRDIDKPGTYVGVPAKMTSGLV